MSSSRFYNIRSCNDDYVPCFNMKPNAYLEAIDAKLEEFYKSETITMEVNLNEPEDYVRGDFVDDCVPLRDMNDLQIEKYIELNGRCTFDERDEWSMVYTGGNILRYSYCTFIQWGIEDQTVSNITITRALFDEITFTNYVFDGVYFEKCVFKEIILNNTTFKNCTFHECTMDSSIVPDESCEVINYHPYYDSDDNVVYRFY